MHPSFIPPRQVMIGDAAWFAGTTPRGIRHYEQIGVLPEAERGSDGRRRYDYEAMIRLLWVRKMADVGIALDDIRRAFDDPNSAGVDDDLDVSGVLARLEADLVAQAAELQRKRAAVRRMRSRGSRMGLLDDLVVQQLEGLPAGSLSQAHVDTLLVIERILGPLGAAIHAGRYIAVASDPALLAESERLDAAEAALDDMVAVDDPRVAQIAAERHVFERGLRTVIENSVDPAREEALLRQWEDVASDLVGDAPDPGTARKHRRMSAFEALGAMPYDFSLARVRCMQIAEEMAAREAALS